MRSRNIEAVEIAVFREITDQWYNKKLADVSKNPDLFREWKVVDNMLYKHSIDDLLDPIYNKDEGWRLVVPVEYSDQFLWDGHNEPFSGHFRVEKTYDRIARDFYWPGIRTN